MPPSAGAEVGACAICAGRLDGPAPAHPGLGPAVHPACLAARLPEDALVLAVTALALLVVPMAVVWAS